MTGSSSARAAARAAPGVMSSSHPSSEPMSPPPRELTGDRALYPLGEENYRENESGQKKRSRTESQIEKNVNDLEEMLRQKEHDRRHPPS